MSEKGLTGGLAGMTFGRQEHTTASMQLGAVAPSQGVLGRLPACLSVSLHPGATSNAGGMHTYIAV